MHIGLVYFHGPHCVAHLVAGGAGVLKSIGIVATFNVVAHILSTSVSKLVAQAARPSGHLTLPLLTEVEQVLRRVQFPCRRWFIVGSSFNNPIKTVSHSITVLT